MTRIFVGPSVTAIFCFAASAQSPDASRFEAADIHASAPSSNIRDSFMQGPFVGGGRFEIRKATIVDLIRLGWNVQPARSSADPAGPVWTVSTSSRRPPKAPPRPTSGLCFKTCSPIVST
jgi:hypothetical protein